MSGGPLAFELVVVFVLTVVLLNKYGNWRKQHFVVTGSTFVGWYFSFLIIFVLPLDVAITFYNRCRLEESRMRNSTDFENITIGCVEPDGYVPDRVLLNMWRFVYWTAQLLTWIVLPLMQSYSNAGDFTGVGKLRSAAYNNGVYYGTYLVVFFFLLIYAAAKGVSLNAEHLKVILISASNTWGLFLLVVLLGYGLVEVPRHLWLMGNKGYRLNKTYFDIDKLSADKNDAEDTLKEVYKEARSVLSILRNEHTLREYAQTIVGKFPAEFVTAMTTSRSGSAFSGTSTIAPTEANLVGNQKYLIRLHKRTIDAIQNHHRTVAQWNALMRTALYLEDVQQAESTGQFIRSSGKGAVKSYLRCPTHFQYFWHVIMKRPLLQVIGVAFFMMTAVVMWSECTFFIVHPRLSIAAQAVHSAALGYHYHWIQAYTMAIISYLCVCAYYTVFKLRIYRYYHLDPHHMTDENSLLFSAILLCRLTPPICLNVLGMIHLDSHITSDIRFGVETQFTKLMGHLDVIPLLAKGINIYLPILIVLLCLGTWFRLGSRFLHSLGIDQFVSDDDMTAEMVQGGRALVSLERSKLSRAANREERDQFWAEKLAESGAAVNAGNRSGSSSRAQQGGPPSGLSSSSRFSGIREYSDREPIIGADDGDEYSSFGVGESFHRNYGSPGEHPSPNMFDDL